MSNKRKILWINEHPSFVGGAETYIYSVVEALKSMGHESYLLYNFKHSPDVDFCQHFAGAFPYVEGDKQITTNNFDIIYGHNIWEEEIINEIERSGIPTYRFIHDHKLDCLREHKVKPLTGVRCTEDVGFNCYKCLGFISRSKKFLIKFNSLHGLKKSIQYAHKWKNFVVGSSYMKERLASKTFKGFSIHKNPLFTSNSTNQIQNKFRNKRNAKKLLFVGQLVKGKGLDILLKALKGFNENFHLDICGDGKSKSEYIELVKQLGLDSKVSFLGHVSKNQIAEKYRDSGCVIIPSRQPETFCLVGVEAMSMGAYVIASNAGGMTEWLEDGVNGRCFHNDSPEELRKALKEYFNNPNIVAQYTHQARRDVTEKFNLSIHVQNLLKIFGEISPSFN